jgi:hypothetical protein
MHGHLAMHYVRTRNKVVLFVFIKIVKNIHFFVQVAKINHVKNNINIQIVSCR